MRTRKPPLLYGESIFANFRLLEDLSMTALLMLFVVNTVTVADFFNRFTCSRKFACRKLHRTSS
jgi:hypothetical protein